MLSADTKDMWKASQERTGLEWSSLVALRADPCVHNAWLGITLLPLLVLVFKHILTYEEGDLCCI